jgi:nitrilase
MPLTRTAMYAQGENLHIAVWPGSDYNTKDISRFIARESRSYVISASAVLSLEQIKTSIPDFSSFIENAPTTLANGGSCVANPDGTWLIEPQCQGEKLIYADLSIEKVYEERQNFDPVGHYARPDFKTERQKI